MLRICRRVTCCLYRSRTNLHFRFISNSLLSTEYAQVSLSVFAKVKEALESNNGVLLGLDEDNRLDYKQRYNDKEDEKDEKAFRKVDTFKLRNCLRLLNTQVPFAIGGVEYMNFKEHIVKMCLSEDVLKSDNFCEVGSVCNLSVQSVLQFCKPSHFGVMECKADRIVIEDTKSNNLSFVTSMRRAISKSLLAESYPHIELVLDKLNIYSEFSHFKPHTDTPTHDPSKFLGRVVVYLPSHYEGGELIVRHADQENSFDFAKDTDQIAKIKFAAFYGNCDHEVRPVTAGHCITLTYSILIADNEVKDSRHYYCNAEVTQTSGIYEPETRIRRILNETFDALQTTLGTNGYLGIFLSHHYTHSGLMAANLKDIDKLLYDLLLKKRVPVSLVPVVSRYVFKRYDADYNEYDNGAYEEPEFSVRLIDGLADGRISRIIFHLLAEVGMVYQLLCERS